MYLHVGNGETLRKRNIIGIFDLDTATVSGVTRRFIAGKEKQGLVEYGDADLPRAFLLMDGEPEGDPRQSRIRLSRISSAVLRARAEEGEEQYGE